MDDGCGGWWGLLGGCESMCHCCCGGCGGWSFSLYITVWKESMKGEEAEEDEVADVSDKICTELL